MGRPFLQGRIQAPVREKEEVSPEDATEREQTRAMEVLGGEYLEQARRAPMMGKEIRTATDGGGPEIVQEKG
jgi:hypothetical protein